MKFEREKKKSMNFHCHSYEKTKYLLSWIVSAIMISVWEMRKVEQLVFHCFNYIPWLLHCNCSTTSYKFVLCWKNQRNPSYCYLSKKMFMQIFSDYHIVINWHQEFFFNCNNHQFDYWILISRIMNLWIFPLSLCPSKTLLIFSAVQVWRTGPFY